MTTCQCISNQATVGGLSRWSHVTHLGCLWLQSVGCVTSFVNCSELWFHIQCYYRISMLPSNSCRPRIVPTQSKALDQNKRRFRIVAAANKRSTRTCVRIISDDGHHTSARTVCLVRVIYTADSRTERLCVLLTASSNCLLMSLGFPKK